MVSWRDEGGVEVLGRGQEGMERKSGDGGSGWLFPADEMMREKRGWGSGRAMEEGDRGREGRSQWPTEMWERRARVAVCDQWSRGGGLLWVVALGQPKKNSNFSIYSKIFKWV
jgi:hypothetical protein